MRVLVAGMTHLDVDISHHLHVDRMRQGLVKQVAGPESVVGNRAGLDQRLGQLRAGQVGGCVRQFDAGFSGALQSILDGESHAVDEVGHVLLAVLLVQFGHFGVDRLFTQHRDQCFREREIFCSATRLDQCGRDLKRGLAAVDHAAKPVGFHRGGMGCRRIRCRGGCRCGGKGCATECQRQRCGESSECMCLVHGNFSLVVMGR